MKDKGGRDYTLNSTTRGPTKGVQLNLEAAVTRRSGQACSRLTRLPLHPASLAVVRRSRVARIRPSAKSKVCASPGLASSKAAYWSGDIAATSHGVTAQAVADRGPPSKNASSPRT